MGGGAIWCCGGCRWVGTLVYVGVCNAAINVCPCLFERGPSTHDVHYFTYTLKLQDYIIEMYVLSYTMYYVYCTALQYMPSLYSTSMPT